MQKTLGQELVPDTKDFSWVPAQKRWRQMQYGFWRAVGTLGREGFTLTQRRHRCPTRGRSRARWCIRCIVLPGKGSSCCSGHRAHWFSTPGAKISQYSCSFNSPFKWVCNFLHANTKTMQTQHDLRCANDPLDTAVINHRCSRKLDLDGGTQKWISEQGLVFVLTWYFA